MSDARAGRTYRRFCAPVIRWLTASFCVAPGRARRAQNGPICALAVDMSCQLSARSVRYPTRSRADLLNRWRRCGGVVMAAVAWRLASGNDGLVDNRSETGYVAVDGADVAYRVVGDGPVDLVVFLGINNHIELMRTVPRQIELLGRFSSFSRLILLDRRGTGASDRIAGTAYLTCEQWTEDLLAVLDAVGSTRAAIYASVDAGPIAILFAAMHPERVLGLVLINTTARYLIADDYPIGASQEQISALVDLIGQTWGTNEFAQAFNPEMSDDPTYIEDAVMLAHFAATPREAAAQYEYLLRNVDVRQALPLIQVPTRVLHVRHSPVVPLEHGRYLAEHIPGATLVELPGASLSTTPNGDAVIEETADLLTGERPPIEVDRILATMIFTDIVGSTERAASLGDHRWRSLLDGHDRAVREQLRRHRGREIETSGDSFFASFDGPARAIRCAQAIVQSTGKLGIELRVGLHTGECEVRGDHLGGLAVHIAARVGALAASGEVLVSETVKDLVVGSGIDFTNRGEHQLKGVPGSWKLFAVEG